MSVPGTYVATVNVRDDFFNDPFFKDWWSEFEGPVNVLDTPGQRKTLVDSFYALKENNEDRGHTYQQSGSAEAASLSLKDGLFKLEVDIHEFEPEDIDISVEGEQLTVTARKEIKRGKSSNFREFNEKFAIPSGVDVSKLSSEITGDGVLIISGPQVEDIVKDEDHKGDTDVSSSSEAKKVSSESHFEVEGGRGTTKKNEASNKTRRDTVTKRVTEDGWEEEIYEEYEEEEVKTKTTTLITASGTEGVQVPVTMGGLGGRETVEVVSSNQNMKMKDGLVVEVDNSSARRTQNKEVIIPIVVEGHGQPGEIKEQEKPRTPRPRVLPFHFPSIALPSQSLPLMPHNPFDMSMPSASDMMAQMQLQMHNQMAFAQMQMAQVHQANMVQMEQMMLQQQQSNMMAINYQQQSQQTQQTQQSQQCRQYSEQQQQQFLTGGYDTPNLTIEDIDEDQDDQDFYVPLKQIGHVENKSALSEATAMAKMKDEMFELVINIHGFEPEDVEIFCVDQSVFVKAKHITEQGFVNNVYEQKFNLPEDVETEKMSSGMSRDGILMIRVPRRESPDRVIPITREVKLEAVKKGLAHYIQYDVEISETSADQIKTELDEKQIKPLSVENQEDVVKAASAEVIEALTVGVSESSGAESGEQAGMVSAREFSRTSTAVKIATAVQEFVAKLGHGIAGEAGVKAALDAALDIATQIGIKFAGDEAAELGAELGRVTGSQAGAVAGAEELAKMKMADITEERAEELRAMFEELGTRVGGLAGEAAGKDCGLNIDPTPAIKEALTAAKEIAENAAYRVRDLLEVLEEEARQIGSRAGELAGKTAGEINGEKVAVERSVSAGVETARKIITAVMGPAGEVVAENTGRLLSQSVASKLGRDLGGAAGFAAGRIAGARAAVEACRAETGKVSVASLTEEGLDQLTARIRETAARQAGEAATVAGEEAGAKIDLDLVLAEVVQTVQKASEEKADEYQAFQSFCAELARQAGQLSGKVSGAASGGQAGVEVAVTAAVTEALAECERGGREIFGETGATVAKVAGEAVATELSLRLGRELGSEAGAGAGAQAGGEAGYEAGKAEALKQNVFNMSEAEVEQFHHHIRTLGSEVGSERGGVAGREAGLKINIPRLVKEVLLSAVRAGEEAANMAKAEGDEAQAKEMEKILVGCCSQAASHEGETEACKATEEQLEVFILENFDKICEEAGALKGREIFGDFGAQVGVESGLIAGRKAVFDLAMGKIKENLKEEGKLASFSQAEIESKEKLSTENLQGLSKEKVSQLRQTFTELGKSVGLRVGRNVVKPVLEKLDLELLRTEARTASSAAAEKYAVKAREFQKLAMKIAEDAGGQAGEETGESEGGETGEAEGGAAGEKVGREAGAVAGQAIAGEDGARVGGEAGAKAGLKFGLKVGREAGLRTGAEVGRLEGRKAGREAAAKEALKLFTIGITKEKVALLKKTFADLGTAEGVRVGKTIAREAAAKKGEEEGSKFGLEQGKKCGAAAARKLKDNEGKKIKEEAGRVAETLGTEVGGRVGASEGEKAAGEEAARLGGDEGERVGREIAGDEGARIGREVGADAARTAGRRHGRKVGKLAGVKAGLASAKTACVEHAALCTREISREKVKAMVKLFGEIATGAAQKEAAIAARAAVMKDIYEIAIRAAGRAAREKILAMASKGQIRLKSDWRPTSLIGVINARADLSDMEKVRLAAKSKMDSNISDLLPTTRGAGAHSDDPLVGKLQFSDSAGSAVRGDMKTAGKKWKSVLITDEPAEKKGYDPTQDNVNTLKKRFETKNLKNNQAYVIM